MVENEEEIGTETEKKENAKGIEEGIGMVMEIENARKAGREIESEIGSATGTETATGETKRTAIATGKNREVNLVVLPLLSLMSGIRLRVPTRGIVTAMSLPRTRLENGVVRLKMM